MGSNDEAGLWRLGLSVPSRSDTVLVTSYTYDAAQVWVSRKSFRF